MKKVRLSMADEFGFYYAWKNNAKRLTLYHRSCRIIARGKMNSILIGFENGQREIVSRYSIRKINPMLSGAGK